LRIVGKSIGQEKGRVKEKNGRKARGKRAGSEGNGIIWAGLPRGGSKGTPENRFLFP